MTACPHKQSRPLHTLHSLSHIGHCRVAWPISTSLPGPRHSGTPSFHSPVSSSPSPPVALNLLSSLSLAVIHVCVPVRVCMLYGCMERVGTHPGLLTSLAPRALHTSAHKLRSTDWRVLRKARARSLILKCGGRRTHT